MAYLIKHNNPDIGYISWANLNMRYNGTSYEIDDGYTCKSYAWWEFSDPYKLQCSDDFPSHLSAADCLVLLNKNGIATLVPGTTVMDGSLIVPGTILSQALSADSITGVHIVSGSIETQHMAAGAITASTIAANAIGAAAIAAGAITTDKLDAQAVTATKIAAGAIISEKLATGAVDADNIAANAITAVKINAGAVNADKIAAGTITTSHFNADGISANILTSGKILSGLIHIGEGTTFEKGYELVAYDDIGDLAYESTVEKSMLGETLIDGGYLKTELIDTSAIVISYEDIDGNKPPAGADITSTVITNGLITTGTLQVKQGGTSAAGITGNDSGETATRFWAGSDFINKDSAPFRVTQDGKLVATDATITGKITATSGSFSGVVNASDFKINGNSVLTNNKINGDYLTNVVADSVSANWVYAGNIGAGQITSGTLSANYISGGTITGVIINVNTDATVGNNLSVGESIILRNSFMGGGIKWGNQSSSPAIYREPSGAITIFNDSPVYVSTPSGSFRLDQLPVAVFG